MHYKSIFCTLGILVSSFLFCLPIAQATNPLSLTVEYVYEEQGVADTQVDVYLVATVNGHVYTLTPEFQGLDVNFATLLTPASWREEGEAVASYIKEHNCNYQQRQTTDATGTAYFADLAHGVYYVDVADVDVEGGTLVSSPVLITLPTFQNETGTYTYDVVMEPKVAFEPDKPTTPDKPDTPDDPETPPPPEDPPEIPKIPFEPEPPDYHVEIPEITVPLAGGKPFIPQTGTYGYLGTPLALMGLVLLLVGVCGLGDKKRRPS